MLIAWFPILVVPILTSYVRAKSEEAEESVSQSQSSEAGDSLNCFYDQSVSPCDESLVGKQPDLPLEDSHEWEDAPADEVNSEDSPDWTETENQGHWREKRQADELSDDVNYLLEHVDPKRGKPSFNSWGGKRTSSFHSWGGKRSEDTSSSNDIATETKRSDPFVYLKFADALSSNNGGFKRRPAFNSWGGKRSPPAFNSWGGKRAPPAFNSWGGKRAPPAPAFNSWGGKRGPSFNSWGGKRGAQFNSWGGKRGPSFNSWGGKRGPSFNSWGGKRGAQFNSWGGKRGPSFNSWGGKRGAQFNSWGGKRGAQFNSWGGKRAAQFNSWGGKRDAGASAAFNSWGGKRGPAFNSWGGKRSTAFNSWGGKRAAPAPAPAFNSWGGKRGPAFYSWGGKRSLDLVNNDELNNENRDEKNINPESDSSSSTETILLQKRDAKAVSNQNLKIDIGHTLSKREIKDVSKERVENAPSDLERVLPSLQSSELQKLVDDFRERDKKCSELNTRLDGERIRYLLNYILKLSEREPWPEETKKSMFHQMLLRASNSPYQGSTFNHARRGAEFHSWGGKRSSDFPSLAYGYD